MEGPVINMLSDFNGRVTYLQNPSLLSQILSLPTREKLLRFNSFWTWSAFIIAAIASFGTIIRRIRILMLRLQCHYCKSSELTEPLLTSSYDDVSDYSDDEDDAVSWSSSSSVSDLDDDEPGTSSFSDDDDDDCHVRGSGLYGDHKLGIRRFSWSDFSSGKSVVKLWGLGFDLNNNNHESTEYHAPAIASSSTATFLSAESVSPWRVKLGVWDARVGCGIPSMLADWGIAGVEVASDGDGKVYVRDDVIDGVTVGDLRNFGLPLKCLTGINGVDELGCDSAVTRCCDAVRSSLLL